MTHEEWVDDLRGAAEAVLESEKHLISPEAIQLRYVLDSEPSTRPPAMTDPTPDERRAKKASEPTV